MSEQILNHFSDLQNALVSINKSEMSRFLTALMSFFRSGNSLFIGGNGGSQAIAEHIATDWTKGVFTKTSERLRVISLNSISATQTAIANDLGYEHSLSLNLDILSRAGDAVFLISSSGNSENVLRAAQVAKTRGCIVFAFSGFGESKLYEVADFAITIPSSDYQVIEDSHAILGHAIYKHVIDSLGNSEV